MSGGTITTLGFFALMAIIVIATNVSINKGKTGRRENSSEPPPVPPSSLSLLAGLSFFSGLAGIFLASVTGILSLTMSMDDLYPVSESTRRQVDLAAKIVLYVSLLPAVGAVAFALAARGVISESRGSVRGRPLYRTGLLLAVTTAVIVFDAKILNPATWARASDLAGESSNAEQGFLGVEHGPLDNRGYIPVIRVVPGSPADRAGLKAGDPIDTFDGASVQVIGSLPDRIRSLKPGTKVAIGVVRRTAQGSTHVTLVAELAASFDSLLDLLKSQSLDDERLAVLKAAGADRRYSADELRQVCAAFDLDSNRLKAIETALPKLQDPQNAYQILGALDHSSSKKKVSEWVEAAKQR